MNHDELLNKPTETGRPVEPGWDAYDDQISLQPLLRTVWLYRQVISLAVAGVMGIFAVAMLAAYIFQAVERLGTLEFRLLFEGASQGQYPNGTLFSSAENHVDPGPDRGIRDERPRALRFVRGFQRLDLRSAVEPRARDPLL